MTAQGQQARADARGLRDRPKHSGWKEDISTFISPLTLWGDARVAGQSCPSFCFNTSLVLGLQKVHAYAIHAGLQLQDHREKIRRLWY